MRSQPHPLNWEEDILHHVYDTLIRDVTPHMHRASTAQNWLLGHMLTVGSCMASHSCVYKCLLISLLLYHLPLKKTTVVWSKCLV